MCETTPDHSDVLDEVRARYPDWEITREPGGGLRAVHRYEPPDARLEMSCIYTEVTATWPEQLSSRLFVQEALRRGQAMDRIPAPREAR